MSRDLVLVPYEPSMADDPDLLLVHARMSLFSDCAGRGSECGQDGAAMCVCSEVTGRWPES